ncbi:MAG TPA: hypothetical protein VNE82_03045 [Candidatus Binataceae bacterium]|nr:hypothetical protein [Candidatus Binataceae bacterium]
MRNLPLPARESDRSDLLRAIKTYRYGGRVLGYTATSQELDAILALYDRYDADRAAPCEAMKGGAFPTALTDAVHDAFESTQQGRKLHSIRKTLFSGVDLCPICGIGPVVELDHYLPRSVFKPLAIYARNLVPMCHACNLAKLAGFGDQDEQEQRFLHAYFDALPDVSFLSADVSIRDGGLVVEFGIDEGVGLPDGYARRLEHQITELGLNARYRSEVNTYITSHAIALHLQHATGGGGAVCAFLRLQARYETGAFYRNHWRPTLLAALAIHDEFTDGGFAAVLPVPRDMLDDMAGEHWA